MGKLGTKQKRRPKIRKSAEIVPAPCLQGETAKIDVISDSVSLAQQEAPTRQNACSREADRKAGKTSDSCIAENLEKLVKGIETLAVSRRGEKREFRLTNDTSCPICFTYNRCNDYGCWDEVVMASAKSTLFAGVTERAPVIKNPLFCKWGRAPAYVEPPLPPRKPILAHLKTAVTDVESPPPLPPRKPEQTQTGAADSRKRAVEPEAMFLAAKEKARREGVHTLTSEDIIGLSLGQIKELRGY